MLLTDFYKVLSITETEPTKYVAVVLVNEKHEIFNGHFPQNPVVPGVCMMQIIKQLTEEITQQSLVVERLSNVKFIALINPESTPELRLELEITEIEKASVKVKNTTFFNETVALKLSCIYKKL